MKVRRAGMTFGHERGSYAKYERASVMAYPATCILSNSEIANGHRVRMIPYLMIVPASFGGSGT